MIKTLTTIVLLITAIYLKGQDSTDYSIIFDKIIHDFGIIDKGSKAECVFSFINKTEKPLAIIRVTASCGCTVPVWSKKPVEPNGSGKISVKYNSNITGSFHKTITIFTTSDKKPIELVVKGEVLKKKKGN